MNVLMDKECATENLLLGAICPQALELIRPSFRSVYLKADTLLHEQGDQIDSVYFPRGGLVSLVLPSQHGIMSETGVIGFEGALGIHAALGSRRAASCAVVQIGGQFDVIRTAELRPIVADYHSFRELIALYTELRLTEAQHLIACHIRHHVEERLCYRILTCSDRTGSDVIDLTHEFLAKMLGVNRTTVSLTAHLLQKDKLISYSRGKITICDRDGLQSRACNCYEATRPDILQSAIGAFLWPPIAVAHRARALRTAADLVN